VEAQARRDCREVIGKLLSPSRRRACIDLVCCQFKVSERRVCRVLGQHRSTQRRLPKGRADEERLVADMIELTRQYGRYGYRRIAVFLRDAGWQVNDKRVDRLWRREGLKVPMKQPKKGRLWLNPSRDIAAQCPVRQWMGHASDCVQSIATMCGRMTLYITGQTMAGRSGRSTSWMNTAGNASQSA
jgi:hypothetical protein